MMALGELGDIPDVFDSHPWKYQLYILFFLITLITQIVYLNMIIAFMSDTFDYMMELKPILALEQQMKIMSTSRMFFGNNDDITDEEKRFLLVIEPVNQDDDEDGNNFEIDADLWRGRIYKIQQHIESNIKKLQKNQDKKI